MPQTSKVSRNNTTIVRHPDGSLKRVILHNTVVFEQGPIREDGSRIVAISNGGWNTVTTQTRINQCFRESGLPMRYSRAGGEAVIHHRLYAIPTVREAWEMPPHGRALLIEFVPGCGWKQCTDSFVVING